MQQEEEDEDEEALSLSGYVVNMDELQRSLLDSLSTTDTVCRSISNIAPSEPRRSLRKALRDTGSDTDLLEYDRRRYVDLDYIPRHGSIESCSSESCSAHDGQDEVRRRKRKEQNRIA